MWQTVEGIYRNGQIELSECPAGAVGDIRVLVTFMASGDIDLRQRGIDQQHAAEMRARLAPFAEDWDAPEMSDYDDYDSNRGKLEAG